MLDHIALQLNREGIKEREDSERRGGRGRLFEGGDYFEYFGQRGAIIRGRRLIEGRLLFEEIRKVAKKVNRKKYPSLSK